MIYRMIKWVIIAILFTLLFKLNSCGTEDFDNWELYNCFQRTSHFQSVVSKLDSTEIAMASEYFTDQLTGRWLLYQQINNQNIIKFLGHDRLYIELKADSSFNIFQDESLISTDRWTLKLDEQQFEIQSDISAYYFPGRFHVCENELRIFSDPENNFSYYFVKQ